MSKEFIEKQEMFQKTAMEKALKVTNPEQMKTNMLTAKFAAEEGDKRNKILNMKQEELAHHMGKKPRSQGSK